MVSRLNVGGPARLLASLASELDPGKFDVLIAHGGVECNEVDFADSMGARAALRQVPGLGRRIRILDDVKAFLWLLRLIGEWKPDVVHTHLSKAGLLGRLAASVRKVPAIVHTFHGHVLRGYFSPLSTKVVVVLERLLARRTDRLIAVGESIKNDLLGARIGKPEQYEVIHPGIPLTDPIEVSAARASLGIDTVADVVVFVGRLTRIKRVDRLLEAMKIVRESSPGIRLLVAGDGDLMPDLRELARDFELSADFLGNRDDVTSILAAADVVVLTSDNEGVPLALIEAGVANRPVVATDVGSVREVVIHEETGLLVSTDPTMIAEAITLLLRHPAMRDEMGRRAGQHCSSHFSEEVFVGRHSDLYRVVSVERRTK